MDGVGEIRNILLILSKRLESLERRVSDVSAMATQAKERGDVANQLIFSHDNQVQHDQEIQLIRKLFGDSGPTLGDMIPDLSVMEPDDTELLGFLVNQFEAEAEPDKCSGDTAPTDSDRTDSPSTPSDTKHTPTDLTPSDGCLTYTNRPTIAEIVPEVPIDIVGEQTVDL